MSQQTTVSQATSNGHGNGSTPTPGGKVQIGDIKAKLRDIDSEVRGAAEVEPSGKRAITLGAVAVVVGVIVLAFVLGRKRGRRTTTWVEVRRL